ncbi:MAG: radical SAM protein [Bdellovibrionia bacterium]
MRVSLVRPPLMFPRARPPETVKIAPPLGLAYVAGTLRAAGHEVICVDGQGEGLSKLRDSKLDLTLIERGLELQEIVARIPADTQVIGVSSMFSFEWFYMIELIRAIRAKFPAPFLVVGGEHATADYDYVLRTMPEVDACVLGEGENKMLGLVDALEKGAARDELPGVAYRDSQGKVVKNPERDGEYRIQDINSIPRPAWDLIPLEEYHNLYHSGPGVRVMPMQGTRGCPYQCTFCSSAQMWTTRWKPRSVDDLIDEIKSYVQKYKINRVEFTDLTLIVDEKWVTSFCRRLIDENLGITWAMPTGTRTEALTPQVLRLLKASGCARVTYPLETGSIKTSARIKKKINFENSLTSMSNAVKTGIIVKTNIVIGFPFQNLRDILTEYLFAVRLAWIGANDVTFFNFVPYPGSELHEQLVLEGKIVKDATYPAWLSRVFLANYSDNQSWCPGISESQLKLLCVIGIAIFYGSQFLFRPKRAFQLIYRVYSRKPLTLLEIWLTNLLPRFTKRPSTYLMGEQHA